MTIIFDLLLIAVLVGIIAFWVSMEKDGWGHRDD